VRINPAVHCDTPVKPVKWGAMSLRGHRLEDESLTEAKQGSLMRLFQAMVDIVERGISVEMNSAPLKC